MNAQRSLGVRYATGDDWSSPKDLTEAVRWYRLAAEKGHAESQYDLGFMLLLGEGAPKNIDEGLMWLESAGELGEYSAFRLLANCYQNGYCDVPVDAAKAALWRARMEDHHRLHPPDPARWYSLEGSVDESSLGFLWDIEGVNGFTLIPGDQFSVRYDPALITTDRLDEKVLAAGLPATPKD